jgi:hypothetical protein
VKNENLATRITLTEHPGDIDPLISELWRAYLDGELTEHEVKSLDIAARKRRTVLQAKPPRYRPILAATTNDLSGLFNLEIDAG